MEGGKGHHGAQKSHPTALGLPWCLSSGVGLPMQGTQVRSLVQEVPHTKGQLSLLQHKGSQCLQPTRHSEEQPHSQSLCSARRSQRSRK